MKKAEAEFQRHVRALGCIVCRIHRRMDSPAEIHHMLSGGRRRGEMFVLGLCFEHHRAGRNDHLCVSRDHNQRRFEAAYGTEESLLAKTRELIKEAMTV